MLILTYSLITILTIRFIFKNKLQIYKLDIIAKFYNKKLIPHWSNKEINKKQLAIIKNLIKAFPNHKTDKMIDSQLQATQKPQLKGLRKPVSTQKKQFKSFTLHSQINDPQIYDNDNRLSKYEQIIEYENKDFKFVDLIQHDLQEFIDILYKAESYQQAELYGFNIRSLQHSLRNGNKVKIATIWTMFQILNWESCSLKHIQNYIQNFPTEEGIIDEIQIQGYTVKLSKLKKSLHINLVTNQYILKQKQCKLNRYQSAMYCKSLTKLTHQLQSYQFYSPILQIQSNPHLIAIRTIQKVFIIPTNGKCYSFNYQAKQIQLNKCRCVVVLKSGEIVMLAVQMIYKPKLYQVFQEQGKYQDLLGNGEFVVAGDQHILIAKLNIKEKILAVRKIGGKPNLFKFQFAGKQQNLTLTKAFIKDGYVHFLIFYGNQPQITKILELKYFISL